MNSDVITPSLRNKVETEIPSKFLRDFCLVQPRLYDLARQTSSEYLNNRAERNYLYPHFRRALVEQSMIELASQYPDAKVHERFTGNKSSFFREVHFGSIALTASFVRSPEKLVRRADFRLTRAKSNQLSLFEVEEELTSDYFYAILLHGSHYQGSRSTFTYLAFPSPDLQGYVEKIDLIQHCSINANNIEPEDIEKIEDRVQPRLILERLKSVL